MNFKNIKRKTFRGVMSNLEMAKSNFRKYYNNAKNNFILLRYMTTI